jgi:hypothetical protein
MKPGRQRVISDLLSTPALSMGIIGAGAAHIALCAGGFGGWQCPIYQATGWPCPGCGLGRACALLLRGEWTESIRVHAFAPVLLFALAVLGAGFILRGRAKRTLHTVVTRMEDRANLGGILLGALIIYWFSRLMLDGAHFRLLVA